MSSGRSNEKRFRSGRSNPPTRNGASSSTEVDLKSENSTTLIQDTSFVAPVPVSTIIQKSIDSDEKQHSEVVAKYQFDLNQKDELITALIQELEQAVEQLDRFQRVGADRSHSIPQAPTASSVFDLAESKSPFMDDFHQMVADWERSQPASAIERIENQLGEIRDLVLDLQRSDRPQTDAVGSDDRRHRIAEEPAQSNEEDLCNMTLDASSSSWDAIKNQLFGCEETLISQPVNSFANDAADSDILRLMTETPAPQAVDFLHANIEDLKRAVADRDAYIIQLNRLFRTRNSLSLPTDWASLAHVPNEMQVRVESLIEHLDVQVRLGEVEMSLERARLARERSQIQSEREHIEKHMKRLGLSSIADLDNISAATGTSGDRRWMRFLGPNTK